MLGNLVNRVRDHGHEASAASAASAAQVARIAAPPPIATMELPKPEASARPEVVSRSEPAPKAETISSIGSGMSMTGTIVCDGPMQIYGRVEGELRATEILIGDGAHVEGNIVAQDLTIRGRVKGTIRAVRVKLQGNGTVEGDIFHRSLAIEENALFEGSSRRVENPMETGSAAQPSAASASPAAASGTQPSRAQLKGTLKQNLEALGQVSPTITS